MTSLNDLRDVIPSEAIDAWPHLARSVPDDGILMGGTALTVHLQHRMSRDLDVFVTAEFNPNEIASELRRHGDLAVTSITDGTLNAVFNRTKIQVLHAEGQRVLEPPTRVAGMNVGSLPDIAATKLKVIGDRGELRDYYDLMRLETDAAIPAETAIALTRERYGPAESAVSIDAAVRGLGYFDDVADDPYLKGIEGGERALIEQYWTQRQPQILAHLDNAATTPRPAPPGITTAQTPGRSCGKIVASTGLPCKLQPSHNDHCRSR